jgi:hypothetical protein
MAVGGQPSPLLAVDALDFKEPIINRTGQVGGSPFGLAASYRAVVQDNDGLAFPAEQIGRRQAGDSGPDYADFRLLIVI